MNAFVKEWMAGRCQGVPGFHYAVSCGKTLIPFEVAVMDCVVAPSAVLFAPPAALIGHMSGLYVCDAHIIHLNFFVWLYVVIFLRPSFMSPKISQVVAALLPKCLNVCLRDAWSYS